MSSRARLRHPERNEPPMPNETPKPKEPTRPQSALRYPFRRAAIHPNRPFRLTPAALHFGLKWPRRARETLRYLKSTRTWLGGPLSRETDDLMSASGPMTRGAFSRSKRQDRSLPRTRSNHNGERRLEPRFYRGSPTSSIRVFFFGGRSIKISLYRRVDHSLYVKPL